MTQSPNDPNNPPASPPCFAHELAESDGGSVPVDPAAVRDVAGWRKAERERLIAARLAIPAEDRRRLGAEVAEELERLIEPRPGLMVSFYWPFRGELDLRAWMGVLIGRGARAALPLVEAKGRPLVFRDWAPEARMERGIWNIPVPAEGPAVTPDVVIAPLVGFDPACYRLGYGGGFFDRTLAALSPRPMAIGIGHPSAALATIHPQWHDIPMDAIVTGPGEVRRRDPG